MSTSDSIEFVPNEISVLDWYDGVIRGIAESEGKDYLFIMAAWDWASRRKAFVMINLDPATSSEMKRLCAWKVGEEADEERWDRFEQLYNQYLADYDGPAYLLSQEPVVANILPMTAIPTDHLDELREYDIENTMDLKAKKLWFI